MDENRRVFGLAMIVTGLMGIILVLVSFGIWKPEPGYTDALIRYNQEVLILERMEREHRAVESETPWEKYDFEARNFEDSRKDLYAIAIEKSAAEKRKHADELEKYRKAIDGQIVYVKSAKETVDEFRVNGH